MNYILFNIGKTPKYLKYCINSILSIDKEAKVTLCTDDDLNLNNVEIVNFDKISELKSKQQEIKKLFFNTKFNENPLWAASILRVYALYYVGLSNDIKDFIHFDNDVIIYKNLKDIKNDILLDDKRISITESDNNHLVFGYSYFPNIENAERLCNSFDQILENYQYFSNNFARGGQLNEMRMLKITETINPNLFSILNSLPYEGPKYLFDPSSYGQYLNGTNTKRGNYFFKRSYVSTSHVVGREIKSKRIKVNYKGKIPTVYFENQSFKLVNLHVHSKKLEKFLPKEYKNIVKL
tara:strand:+ start:1532 stop:2413 length:882 start_codon:yes stop_codon:yes gene_type:complete